MLNKNTRHHSPPVLCSLRIPINGTHFFFITCRQVEPEVLSLAAVLANPRLRVRRDLAAAVHVLQAVGVLAHRQFVVGDPLIHLGERGGADQWQSARMVISP